MEIDDGGVVGIMCVPDIEDAAHGSVGALLDSQRAIGDELWDGQGRHQRASFHLAKASRSASAGLVTASDAVPTLRQASTPLSSASIAASSSSSGVGGSGSVTALFG